MWTTADEGRAAYTVEAGIDAWEGRGWWTTHDELAAGFLEMDAATLQAEYSGVLDFLELCKRVGAPRYTIKTELDPNALPHVIAIVEKLLAVTPLRCLLADAPR